MLALVFWHSRNAGSSGTAYRRALAGFHDELSANRPEGFRRSVSFLVESRVPWLPSPYPVFEDWYIMTNFAVFDRLDRQILGGDSLPSHRALMAQTGRASGAVLYLDAGRPFVERAATAVWFSRPADLRLDLAARTQDGAAPGSSSVWTRALGLGPAGQCIVSDENVTWPERLEALTLRRSVFWAP